MFCLTQKHVFHISVNINLVQDTFLDKLNERSELTASFNERLGPIILMIIIGIIVAAIPLWAIRKKLLSKQKDLIFISFWYQTWILINLIPTINCIFPESNFAFPPHQAAGRIIQFSNDQVVMYAELQLLILLLFHFPLFYFYKRCSHVSGKPPAISKSAETRIIGSKLLMLFFFYSVFGILYLGVAVRTGALSGYAVNVDFFLTMNIADRMIWRIYQLSSPFLLGIIILAYAEQRVKKKYYLILLLPGFLTNMTAFLISSRTYALYLVLSIILVLAVRGHINLSSIRSVLIAISVLAFSMYIFSAIPRIRRAALEPGTTIVEALKNLNPLNQKFESLPIDYGFRLDGIELMVLATPYLINKGLVPLSWYIIPIISPILPLMPSLEEEYKVNLKIADFKMRYLEAYTPVPTPDYPSVSLTEFYMLMGPIGFLLCSIIQGSAIAITTKSLRKSDGRKNIFAIFLLFQVFFFESSLISVFTGWIRALPILLIALFLNPWKVKKPLRQLGSGG